MVKFDHMDNHGSNSNKYDKLFEENTNLVKTCDELKQENSKLRQTVKVEKDNSKKSTQKYEKEIVQLTKKVESMRKTNEYLAEQQDILNQQLMEMNKENSKISNDSFQNSPSVKDKLWSIHDQHSPIRDEEDNDEPIVIEEKPSLNDNNQNQCAQQ